MHDFGFHSGKILFTRVLLVVRYEFCVNRLGIAFELIVKQPGIDVFVRDVRMNEDAVEILIHGKEQEEQFYLIQ